MKKKIGLIIFSRMSSTRLPGKALIKINNRELLGRVIDRAIKLIDINNIVVSTSLKDVDLEIVKFCEKEDINCFRGNEDNVLDRAIKTAREFSFDNFIRVCGDRPFFSLKIIELALSIHFENDCDLTTSTSKFSNIPPGLTTEIIKLSALEKILDNNQINSINKEHITSYFYENEEKFKISYLNFLEQGFTKEMRFVVDNQLDLKLMNLISNTVIEWYRLTPEYSLQSSEPI